MKRNDCDLQASVEKVRATYERRCCKIQVFQAWTQPRLLTNAAETIVKHNIFIAQALFPSPLLTYRAERNIQNVQSTPDASAPVAFAVRVVNFDWFIKSGIKQ